uniref:Uncharacterized protein n=1 Tax=Lepeophtheirus salmonis TaxID=72036 RepID=A0A0K2VG53_LEPSM
MGLKMLSISVDPFRRISTPLDSIHSIADYMTQSTVQRQRYDEVYLSSTSANLPLLILTAFPSNRNRK